MAKNLVPAAISSELDITGKERIHAAIYVRVVRNVYFGLSITGNLPDSVEIGEEDDYQYVITGSLPPFTATITAGALPTGLSMDSLGHITGTRTAVGVFTWTVTVTDSEGNIATLDDMSETIAEICTDNRNPELVPVAYLVLPNTDTNEVYAENDYDYTAWDTGLARFDSDITDPSTATVIPLLSKVWYRHEIVLASTTGVQFQHTTDDECQLWIGGVKLYERLVGTGGTATFAIPPEALVVGCNHVAVSSRDAGLGRTFMSWRFVQ